ncbi:YhzD family protein [Ectobacillus funiculus]|uniref:YhzD family protein n=1 Tax=Ectobacillus funiculus TaxID=137993 RepID=A0ABV5WL53_9BACI
MKVYVLTAFAKDGAKLLEESFGAMTEAEAKQRGEEILQQNDITQTYRCTSSSGKLILFHA